MGEWHIVTIAVVPMMAGSRTGFTLNKGERIESRPFPPFRGNLEAQFLVIGAWF